jgi:hypothetical protein
VTIAARVFYNTMMVIALVIGALQAFQVKAGWVTNYGADVFGTAWLYGLFRQGRTVLQRGRGGMGAGATAAFVFAGCAGSELLQAFKLIPGVFDPLDLAAFAVTVVACYLLDRAVDLGSAQSRPSTPLR